MEIAPLLWRAQIKEENGNLGGAYNDRKLENIINNSSQIPPEIIAFIKKCPKDSLATLQAYH